MDGASEDLITRASTGDPVAVESLLEQYLPRLLAYVRLYADPMIREHESCSDVVQSVCRDVFEDMNGFEYRGEAEFRSWLFTCAKRKLINRKRYYMAEKRDAGRRERISQADHHDGLSSLYATIASPSAHAEAKELASELEHAFDRLPEDHKKVITLARILDLTHAEIAVEMDRDVGAVRVLLHRALARLGRLMRAGLSPE